MKIIAFLGVICAAGIATLGHAQEVKRCDGPGGKVTYAEFCPNGTAPSTVTKKGISVTDSDKNQRADEAAFQKRHAARQGQEAKERADKRRSAAAERVQNMKEEKMRRELAMKEERAKRGDSKPKKSRKAKKKTA